MMRVICRDEDTAQHIMQFIHQQGFEFKTPLVVFEDFDLYPEGITPCAACECVGDHTFNCTQFIDGVSWSLHHCHACDAIIFEEDKRHG
jgi:hypothetical protein